MEWRYHRTVLVLCTCAFFVTMAARLVISPVVPAISAEFDVSNALIGTALTGMWLAYALVQFPSGVLADRFGERGVILVSIAGTGAMSVVLVVSPAFGVFLLGTALLGGAAGLHFSVATTLLTRTFDDIATPIGIHNTGAPAAGLLVPVAVSWIAIRYGWRPAVAIVALLAVPVFLAFAWWVRPTRPVRPDQSPFERLHPGSTLGLLARPQVALTVAIAVAFDFTWQGIASFLPTFLVEYHGQSAPTAAAIFAAYFLVQGVLQIGVGAVADRWSRDVAIGLCAISGAAGIALLVAAPTLTVVVIGICVFSLGMGFGSAVIPRFMDHLAEDERGSGFGLVRTVYMILASAGSVVVGTFADRFGWVIAFGLLVVLLVLVIALLVTNAIHARTSAPARAETDD